MTLYYGKGTLKTGSTLHHYTLRSINHNNEIFSERVKLKNILQGK